MIPKIQARGASFKGLAAYLAHEPKAETEKRVAWTHTLNLANDHIPSAVDEMVNTARAAELLKQEAGIRAGGRATENPVKHFSLNWSPEENPTREQMISATEDFLAHMKWQEHQAILIAHNDKHAHVHVMLNAVHPETGLRLDESFERRRAQGWALEYEKERLISGSGVTAGRSAGFWKCGTLLSTNASDLGGEEGLHEGWQQRFAAFSRVVDELEKGEIERQVLLRNTAMGP